MDSKEVTTKFCYCGLPLKESFGLAVCKKHGLEVKQPIKSPKRGRFSGKSKSEFKFNEYK